MNADSHLDTRGLRCPEPIMMLHKHVRRMAVGEVVQVLATDPATKRDIVQFCDFLPHELLHSDTEGEEFHYWIKKGSR
jgi:tRNA 2-thiouridine synthesizing protein A